MESQYISAARSENPRIHDSLRAAIRPTSFIEWLVIPVATSRGRVIPERIGLGGTLRRMPTYFVGSNRAAEPVGCPPSVFRSSRERRTSEPSTRGAAHLHD